MQERVEHGNIGHGQGPNWRGATLWRDSLLRSSRPAHRANYAVPRAQRATAARPAARGTGVLPAMSRQHGWHPQPGSWRIGSLFARRALRTLGSAAATATGARGRLNEREAQ